MLSGELEIGDGPSSLKTWRRAVFQQGLRVDFAEIDGRRDFFPLDALRSVEVTDERTFTIKYTTDDQIKELRLRASSHDEAARWVHVLREVFSYLRSVRYSLC